MFRAHFALLTLRGTLSAVMRTILFLSAIVVVFLLGIGVGVQFVEPHRLSSDVARPWLAFTRQGGIVRVQPAAGGAVAAVDGERSLRAAASAAAEAEEEEVVAEEEEEGEKGAGEEGDLIGSSQDAPIVPPTAWLELHGQAAVELSSPMDELDVSAGAWVYLDSRDRTAGIKTVLSNRAGGCAVNDAHRGYSLFVNNWEAGDRALVLEWRDSSGSGSGCARLSSEPGAIPYDTWTHVGFATSSAKGRSMLFLNGELLKSGEYARKEKDVQKGRAFPAVLGGAGDGQYTWQGRLAYAFVVAGTINPRQLAATVRVTDPKGWAQFAQAAQARLLGLFLLTNGLQPPVGAAELGIVPSKEQSVADVAAFVASRTFTRERIMPAPAGLVVLELTGKVRPSAFTAGGPKVGQWAAARAAEPEPEEEEEKVVEKPAKGGRKAAAKPVSVEVEEPVKAPRKAYTDKASGSKVPASIARGPIPGAAAGAAFDFTAGGNQWVPTMIRLPQNIASGKSDDKAALAAGTFSDEVTQEEMSASDRTGRVRAKSVKAAMQHIWGNYVKHAWGMDELKPQSGRGENNWAGIGMTLLDSLDTLWIMDMKVEFAAAREWVSTSLDFNKHGALSVFETTIRALGGLLAAYDLSGDALFLKKAVDLGNRLMPAFSTSTGIPRASINLATGAASNPGWTGGACILSEMGTMQVELRYLSKATGEASYGAKAEAVISTLDRIHPTNGLYPIYISSDSGQPTTSTVTFGALGDSFFEYLVKVWVQGGRVEPMYRRMYDAAMNGMTSLLLKHSDPSNLAYVADWNGANTEDKMDHLVCFVPGMLALGAYTAGGTPAEENAVRDLQNAKALAYTCWQMYERMETGIAAEFVEFPGGGDLVAAARAPFYILRPEAAESLYILHQLTGNPIYREWGWRMFSAIEKHCRTEFGYGAHPDVRQVGRTPDDRLERCVSRLASIPPAAYSPHSHPAASSWPRPSSTCTCCRVPTTASAWTGTSSTRRRTRSARGTASGGRSLPP